MSSHTRVYITGGRFTDGSAVIEGKDAEHLIKVMRLGVGDALYICDGSELEYDAVISHVSDLYVEVSLGEARRMDSEPYCPIVLYQCLPKGDKMDAIVQKAVELGATEIVPVLSDRCISRPDIKALMKKIERWQRISESAAAQCGRSRIPKVKSAVTFEDACREMQGKHSFICYEGEKKTLIKQFASGISQRSSDGIAFLIGPEGGISDREINKATEAGITPVGLGERILRTETASGYVLSVLDVLTHW